MSTLLRRRRSLGQTVTEYMLMISVVSLGLWAALKTFSDTNGPVQQASNQLAQDYEKKLDNSADMKMR